MSKIRNYTTLFCFLKLPGPRSDRIVLAIIIQFSHVCIAKSYKIGKIINKVPHIYENSLINISNI